MPSTVQLYSQTINDFKRLQDTLYKGQAQIGADSKAETFAQLGTDVTVTQGFSYSAQRAARFINSIDEVARKHDAAYGGVDNIIETVIEFKKNLTLENSTSANVNDLARQADATLDIIRGELNTRDGANFVFAGSKTNEEPVQDLKQQSNYVNGEATGNYYNGDDFKASVDVSSSLRIEYGVTAADGAFKKVIAAINLAKQTEQGNGNYTESGRLLDEAINELTSLRASMGNNSKIFETTIDIQKKAQANFEQKYAEINEPDIVQLTIETGQAQTALTALFQNFGRISNLSLVNYLN